MTAVQKHAWFNLAVVVASLIVVLALTPFGGRGATGGFGLLGLLGLGPLFFRRKGGGIVLDERDQEISRRSLLVAYTVFWLVFVAACVSLPALYGWGGSVPVFVVQSSVFVACMLVVGVSSVATLVQYGLGGTTDAARA
jgi:hypothetical protein